MKDKLLDRAKEMIEEIKTELIYEVFFLFPEIEPSQASQLAEEVWDQVIEEINIKPEKGDSGLI